MPEGMTIDTLDPVDIDQVAPLWKALLDHVAALPDAIVPVRPSDESWELERKEMLEALAGDAFALVARRDGVTVGYLFVRIEGPDPVWYTGDSHAELAHLSVAEGERGNGVGSALMDAMDAELERRGVEDVEIGVDTGNDVAVRLYEGRGYRPDFRIFYGSPGKKPWACLAREEEDRKAGRGRFARPAHEHGASTRPECGRHLPGCTLQLLHGAELDLDGLEPLWSGLMEHHAAVWQELPVRSAADSWRRRRAQYERWLAGPGGFAVVARRAETLVAYAVVEIREPDESFVTGPIAEVHTLVVAPEERGQGLGGCLLDAVDHELERLGVDDLVIGVMAGNDDAHRLYERRGFVPFVNVLIGHRGATSDESARPSDGEDAR